MSTVSKPTIVLSPGAWHTPDCYDVIRAQLAAKGYETEAIGHPSIGAEPPNKNATHDAAELRATLERLADQGKELVVVMHSYGGLVGSIASEGLGVAQRRQAGKKGGVLVLVFLSAFVIPKGKSMLDMMGGTFMPWMKFDGDYGNSSEERKIFYNDIEPAEQDRLIAKLKHTSAGVFTTPNTYEAWTELPCLYIICEDDNAIPLPFQEGMAAAMGKIEPFRIKASHSPFISQPEKTVEGVEYAVKVGLEKNGVV